MSNTTDLMVVCLNEDDRVFSLSNRSGIQFNKVSDREKCGGPMFVSLVAYGACYKSLGAEKIAEVIVDFKNTDFRFPETATLIIDDDDGHFTGVFPHEHN